MNFYLKGWGNCSVLPLQIPNSRWVGLDIDRCVKSLSGFCLMVLSTVLCLWPKESSAIPTHKIRGRYIVTEYKHLPLFAECSWVFLRCRLRSSFTPRSPRSHWRGACISILINEHQIPDHECRVCLFMVASFVVLLRCDLWIFGQQKSE